MNNCCQMESSTRKRSNISRKLQSVNNMSSMTSLGMHKVASHMLVRSSTSLTFSNLISSDPKLASLAFMADLVHKPDALVSSCFILLLKSTKNPPSFNVQLQVDDIYPKLALQSQIHYVQ